MVSMTVEEQKKKIWELLKDENVKTVVLFGKSGTGKTWLAREISDRAISKALFDIVLWIFLNRKYDSRALYENIARQLSLFSTTEEWEDDDNEEVEGEKEGSFENLKQKISAMLMRKRCLLILDDEGNKMNEEHIMSSLNSMLPPNQKNQCKVLITRIESDSRHVIEGSKRVEIEIFSEEELVVKTLESALEEAANNENIDITHLCRDSAMFPNIIVTECCWYSRQFFCNHDSVHYNELIAYWIMEGCLGPVDHIEEAYEEAHGVLMELVKHGMLKQQEDNFVFMEGAILKANDPRRRGFGGTARLGLCNVFEDDKRKGLGRITHMDGMIKTFCNGENLEKLSTLLLDGNCLYRKVPETFFQPMKDLQVLALFKPRLKSLPLSLSNMQKLRVLVLRGCGLLEKIDHIPELKELTVLEISGASLLETIPDNLFEQITNLRSLNISAVQITSLPSSLSNLSELRWLILRKCSHLETLPSLKEFKNLELLDLSGATSLKTIHNQAFSSVQQLQMLDLSQTQIKKLPFLQNHRNLTRLLLSGCSSLAGLPILSSLSSLQFFDLSGAINLRAIICFPSNMSNLHALHLTGCSQLQKLPRTTELKHLELIDLSDADSLVEIEDKSFEHLIYLRLLNLSKTKVTKLPSLSNLGNLCQLLLRYCSSLETLPEMEGLTRLEVLDLSGASSLTKIRHLNHGNLRQLLLPGCLYLVELPHLIALQKLEVLDLSGCSALRVLQDKSFEHMTRLSRLDLSETKIECLPSLSNLVNLRHLLLRYCVNLTGLPPLEGLSLEELDLCGSLKEVQAIFLEHMTDLKILNLSRIPRVHLPSISNLVKLHHLSLRGCSDLKRVPDLEALTQLEVLDLSGTAVGRLPSLNSLSNLRQLLLRDCSSLEGLPLLESLGHLEVLDLLGTRIKEFPYGISELTCLKQLTLPYMKDIQVEWGRIKCLPENLDWDHYEISKDAEILTEHRKPSITVIGAQFFQLLEKNPELWETCFKQFHFSVCSEGRGKDGDIYFHGDDFIFGDIHSQTRHFPSPKVRCRSLEIRGFHCFPCGIKDVLRCAEFVSLIENKFLSSLSDLGADNVKDIKGCWIERCIGVKNNLFGEEEHVRFWRSLEILWVSNMINLESIYSGSVQSDSFKNLKCLYLDCCPKLVNVFSSSQVPENLEILQIKFCDGVKTLFGPNTSAECKLQKLRVLHVLELPELERIGAILPSLQIFKARECPVLVNIFSSSQPLETLEVLQIKFCDSLETVFEPNTSALFTLPNLHTLHLWKLPELKSIGVLLPPLQMSKVRECPKLQELPRGLNDNVSVIRGN